MVQFWRHAVPALLAGLGFWLTAAPALSQPSQSQINAVRSNCRSDYMAHCSSVPPGGADSLHCLQNNAPRLSGACRSAVDALKPAATPAAAPAPAPAPAPAAAPPQERAATPQPQRTAAPPPAAPVRQPPKAAKPAPRTAAAPPAPPPAPTLPPAPEWTYTPMPPLMPRLQLTIVRACEGDRQAVCPMVPMGGGRIIDCLARNEPSLSPFCRQTLNWARSAASSGF